jgi:hypothetical protein
MMALCYDMMAYNQVAEVVGRKVVALNSVFVSGKVDIDKKNSCTVVILDTGDGRMSLVSCFHCGFPCLLGMVNV